MRSEWDKRRILKKVSDEEKRERGSFRKGIKREIKNRC